MNPAPPQASAPPRVGSLAPPETAAEAGPYMTALEALVRIRFAEASLAAMEAEGVIAHYASIEAQLAVVRKQDII